MQNFEKRRDRFEFFDGFERPSINICYKLETPDFVSFCKANSLPPFHFFLYHLFLSLNEVDNFKYRILNGKVTKIGKIIASYTVMNQDQNLNFTRFENSSDLKEFIDLSLKAKDESSSTKELIHTGHGLPEHELKNYVFVTSIPWLDFTSIEHPVFKFKSADIPSIAWGKFNKIPNGISFSFAVQAHHGFVDGYHIHLLGETIRKNLNKSMSRA